ncbi:MAG: ATP-dependent DNA helicase RecG [Burkholderiales bacterium]|nr:ATP-dependent DNA helicase RecG [Burkholderiales bacterium]
MQRLGLVRDIDLALHLPLRWEDETRLAPIGGLRDGQTAQVQGTVREARVELRGRRQLIVSIQDDSGAAITLRFLHFYGSQVKAWVPGVMLRVRGEVRVGLLGREMVHPAVRLVAADTPLADRLTPVYPTTAQLPQAYLRKAVAAGLARAQLGEILPPGALPAGLPALREALHTLHHPPPRASLLALEDRSHPAWQRLKAEELLAQQLSQLQARREREQLRAPALAARPGGLHEKLLGVLPFQLTGAQRRVGEEIAADLARTQPMHRLLQGDVGSGKTVVAALAAAIAIDAGWQCALMAPTEILAEQHFRKLVDWLTPLGVQVAWLTGSQRSKQREAMLAAVASGDAALVVGTHAVIQDQVRFCKLGLALIDEQHRFGVAQRLSLRAKLVEQRLEPHLLMMSATPIPRTLAMTYYADLDVSTLDELPPGRTPIVTRVFADSRREEVMQRIRDAVEQGRQVYWVCPLIEESEESEQGGEREQGRRGAADTGAGMGRSVGDIGAGMGRSVADTGARVSRQALQNVTDTHALLSEVIGPGADGQPRVGLLHGRMKARDKAEVMDAFAAGRLAVLVATTVIEVGVDVPNASLMVIEHAERFGLSQLHQLRGRVGRGAEASTCVLLYSPPLSPTGRERLKAMAETTDGFEIARRDLAIRGPGEFMGSRQSGEAMLRFADLQQDQALLDHAREAARWLWAEHPQAARTHIERWLASRAEYLKA